MWLNLGLLEIIYFIFTFAESGGHGVGHLIRRKSNLSKLLNSDAVHRFYFIGILTGNHGKALEKIYLKDQFDYDCNITSDLNTVFDSVEDVNPKIITGMMPCVKRLMGKSEKYLDEENIKLKKKLKDALKLLMTKEGLSVDALKNETDVSKFWDVIGTYFVNSRKKGNETSKSEDLQRKSGGDLHFGLGLGLTLVFLCVAGAFILFCTKDGHSKNEEDSNKTTTKVPRRTVMQSYTEDGGINTVFENGFIVRMAPEKFAAAKLTSADTSSPVAPQFRVFVVGLAAEPPQPTSVSI